MKNVFNSTISFAKKNYKFLLYILFIAMIDVILIHSKHVNRYYNANNYIYILIVAINIFLILMYSFLFYRFNKTKIEKIYLMIILPIGIIFLMLFPMGTIPDEINHFLRALEISQGNLNPTMKDKEQGRYFDASIDNVISSNDYNLTFSNFTKKKSDEKKFYGFGNTALYAFVCYIPQVIGIIIAKILHLPLLLYVYSGRLINFIVFVFLTYNAIKLLPYKKMTLFLILLFPMVLQEAVSLSPDALTISITAFFVSYIMHLKTDNIVLKKRQIFILSLSSLVLSLCKIVYLPICLLSFLIPKECFKTLKRKNAMLISIIFFAVIINLLWLSFSSGFLPSRADVNSSRQLHYIMCNIPSYIGIILRTFANYYDAYFYSSIGIELGRFEVYLSKLLIDILAILFIFVFVFDNNDVVENNKLNYIEKILILIIVFGIVLLINTSLYLQWTPVGNNMVLGIQGRYFIPLYILAMLSISKYNISPKINFANKYVFLFLVMVNIYAASSIFYCFV